MKPSAFYILIILAAGLVVLTLAETGLYQFWEEQLEIQKGLQAKIPYADHIDAFTEQVMHRVVFESLHDPQIADLLKKQNVKVMIGKPGAAAAKEPPLPLSATTNAAPLLPAGAHP